MTADIIYIGKKLGKLSGCPGSGDSRLPLLFYPQPLGQLPVGGDLSGLISGVDYHAGSGAPGLLHIPDGGIIHRHLTAVPGLGEPGGQDGGFSAPNMTEKKNTDLNDTDPSILPPTPAPSARARPKGRMRMDEMDKYRELIKENIDFDLLLQGHPYDQETLDGYVELMVEVCCPRRDFIRIAGEEMPTGVVKSRFLKLNHEHIAYVLDSLSQNTTLEAFQQIVGGPIETGCYLPQRVMLICNSEGKNMKLMPNRENPTDSGDFIAGTFLMCGFEGEHFTSLTPAQQREFEAYFATSGPEGGDKD